MRTSAALAICSALALALPPWSAADAQSAGARPAAGVDAAAVLRVAVNRPYTEVLVDGARVGDAPVEVRLSPGPHRVRLASFGHRAWEGTVVLAPGALTPVRATLRAESDRANAWTFAALTAGLLGTGVAFGLASEGDRAALESSRALGLLDNRDPRIDRGTAFAVLADVAFVVGALAAVATTWLFAVDAGRPSVARVGPARPLLHGAAGRR